jgi:Iron-containing redox enzyme
VKLPAPRGPLTELLAERLVDPDGQLPAIAPVETGDALTDDDVQLALYLCHELHYGGLDGVDDAWEWRPSLIAFRLALEEAMFARLVEAAGAPEPFAGDVGDAIFALVEADDSPPLSRYIAGRATLEQFREFVIHRSAYQLKEADPHTFAIPRIGGAAKAAMVEVQADEYGGGDPERMHSRMFAKTMEALDLDPTPGAYVGRLPASTLATVNLITLFALRRRWRGALVGHLACFEIASPEPNRRYANGLRRLGFGSPATDFYDEHVEADSVHENIAAYDLAGGLARQEPALAGDILFGVRSLLVTEGLFARHILDAWERGESSLLPGAGAGALAQRSG